MEREESSYFEGINLNIVNLWGSALLCDNDCVIEFCKTILGDDECLIRCECCVEKGKGCKYK